MTKIESRTPVELDELPPWDDSDPPDHDLQLSGADGLPLTPYSFDSEQRTLVGIGPQERARRSRQTVAPPESQRVPQSEPPGPFIADDEDAAEDLLPALRRGRGLGERALAVSGVILVPLAALAVMRGLSSHERTPSEVPRPAAARVVASRSAAGESESGAEKAERNGQETPAAEAVAIDANHAGAAEQPSARPQTAPPTEKVVREAAQPAVRLAELAPKNTVVDRSNGDVNAGTIDVESTPPSNVILDGRPLGKSPRVVKVAAGPHTLVFIHPLYGRRSLSVNVHSGATTGAAAEF